MRIAIVDDLLADRQLLAGYIQHYFDTEESLHTAQITSFKSGTAFLSAFHKGLFDVIFLDIFMPEMDGMETARKIREIDSHCLLIFSSVSSAHAVESFGVRAFHYLLKPYDYERFREVFTLCRQSVVLQDPFIEVKESRIQVKVLLREIIYVDYSNHYIQIHTRSRLVKSYMPFRAFADMLLVYPQFLYCYRNCIVNMDAVDRMIEKDFLMCNGERIPIARKNWIAVKQRFSDYTFEKLGRGSG